MEYNTIWNKDNKDYNNEKKIFKKIDTDILIIGGGITGVTTAYFLKDCKKKITLIDKGKLGMGVTGRSTAKISYLQGTIYQDLVKDFGYEKAFEYYKSQKDATEIIKRIVKDNRIECDLEKCDSIIFTLEDKGIKKIKKEKEILDRFGSKVRDVNYKKINSGILVDDTYTFNPVKYIDGIRKIIDKNIDIYESIMANEISFHDRKWEVRTSSGMICAKKVVVACHYPFFLIPSLFPIKTYIKREYVNALEVDEKKGYTAISVDKELHSIRFYDKYLIYGSNQHRLSNKTDYKKNYDKSIEDTVKYFSIKPKYTWMNQDIMSNDGIPFIGEVKDNLYVALGYNAWGMTNGTIAGRMISDLILKGDCRYLELFNPKRVNLPLVINSFCGIFHYLKAYIEPLFKRNNPYYVKIDNFWYGVYIDKDKKKHVVKLICPHMKCNLVFNRAEETWDCPCHGSRFDIDGNVITGPSNEDISDNKKTDER